MTKRIETDILIIGSGPVGASFARVLVQEGREVLMIDGGSQLSSKPGQHLKNAYVYQQDRNHFTSVVQGELFRLSIPPASGNISNLDPYAYWSPQSVQNNINPDQKPEVNMPGASAAYAVGGMGVHWTCATPRLNPEVERWDFIPNDEWDELYDTSQEYFQTNTNVFSDSLRGKVIGSTLQKFLNEQLSSDYPVQQLPVAAYRRKDNPSLIWWTGPADILGPSLDPTQEESKRFRVLPQYLVNKLIHKGGKISHVEAQSLHPWEKVEIYANEFIVAAGAILTPQLLWNSNIFRGADSPLGRYLNDQPLAFTQMVLTKKIVKEIQEFENYEKLMTKQHPKDEIAIPLNDQDPTLWIPVQKGRPWHCQVHKDAFNYGQLADNIDDRLVVDFRWFAIVDPIPENYVSFSDDLKDIRGLPQPTFNYTVPEHNAKIAHEMMDDMVQCALEVGSYLPSSPPQFMPAGASLHYMSTYRMGPNNDGTCVVDPYSRVWGFDNLWLGGPGTFPKGTAANPTLTAGAMAIRSARKLAGVSKKNLTSNPSC
jgi:pyranose oxidase